jgi:hypothetical protein
MSNLNKQAIRFDDSPSIDAFGRARVSTPETIFDSKQLFSKQPLLWAEKIFGGGASVHNAFEAATTMSVSAIGDRVIRQTKQYWNYQPGKSHYLLMTTVLNRTAGVTKKVGYFDANNGLFFEEDGSTVNVVIRSKVTGSVVETRVPQAQWNIDKMDGTGPSKITLDISKAQILAIDLEWLGVGRVRWAFVIDGKVCIVHESLHANKTNNVYMSTPNLPLRYEIEAVSGAPCSMKHICSTLFSEGGFNPDGLLFTADRVNGTSIGVAATEPLISIRKKTTEAFRGISIKPRRFTIMSSSDANVYWQLWVNPTISGGAAPSWFDVYPESGVQADVTRDGTITGGLVVASGYVSNNQDSVSVEYDTKLSIGYDLDYVPDELVLGARAIGSTETVYASINWVEWG